MYRLSPGRVVRRSAVRPVMGTRSGCSLGSPNRLLPQGHCAVTIQPWTRVQPVPVLDESRWLSPLLVPASTDGPNVIVRDRSDALDIAAHGRVERRPRRTVPMHQESATRGITLDPDVIIGCAGDVVHGCVVG